MPQAFGSGAVARSCVRFSRIAPQVVRLEYDPDGIFEDRPTGLVFDPRPQLDWQQIDESDGTLILDSGVIRVHCHAVDAPFGPDTLRVEWEYDGRSGVWHPGDIDADNLGGPLPSMDRVSKRLLPYPADPHPLDPTRNPLDYKVGWAAVNSALQRAGIRFPRSMEVMLHYLTTGELLDLDAPPPGFAGLVHLARRYPPGFLSRAGFTVLNASFMPIISDRRFEYIPRRQGIQDWYFVIYGGDYKAGLQTIRDLIGPPLMIPKYALGLWWSEYDDLGEQDYRQLVADFHNHDLPLDVVVMDLYWHDQKQPHEGRGNAWFGWEWNADRFPNPRDFIDWLRSEGLRLSANVHPGGIPSTDCRFADLHARFPDTLRAMSSPDPKYTGAYMVDWTDRELVEAYFEELHRPINNDGLDIWWIDGGGNVGQAEVNRFYFEFTADVFPDRRPIILSRHGWMYGHRYPIIMTGDSHADWDVLKEEIRVTAQAGNALQTYTSHEIAGHLDALPPDLYVRWSQFGVLSPIMRYHGAFIERRPWKFGEAALKATHEALHLRYRLIPYLYTLARSAYDTGAPMCRPMYIEFPDDENAYAAFYQYMLGDRLLVAPVASEAGTKTVYFPAGDWYSMQSGERISGPQSVTRSYALDEIPLFARGGTVLPMADYAPRVTALDANRLSLTIWGGGKDTLLLYDDDGLSPDYQQGAFRFIPMSFRSGADAWALTIGPAEGTFATGDALDLDITIHDLPTVGRVGLNGDAVADYDYDRASRRFRANLPAVPLSDGARLTIEPASEGGDHAEPS
jgi:hypothetical protein